MRKGQEALFGRSGHGDTAVIEQLYGGPENTNPYFKAANPAPEATMVRSWQGEVWHALDAQIAKVGKTIRKARPAIGFEVDAEFDGNAGPLLVEIKIGLTASDIYEGFGQLMPSLRAHTPILVIPEGSSSVLLDAFQKLDTVVATYSRSKEKDKEVTFSLEFRKLWEP